jgi:hypothetical protein
VEGHLAGEKNGEKIGKPLFTAVSDAKQPK